MPVSPDTTTGSSNPCLAMGPGKRSSAAPINRPRQSIRKPIRLRRRLQSRARRSARRFRHSFPNSSRLRLLRHGTRAAAGQHPFITSWCPHNRRAPRAGSRLLPASAGAIRSSAACTGIRLAQPRRRKSTRDMSRRCRQDSSAARNLSRRAIGQRPPRRRKPIPGTPARSRRSRFVLFSRRRRIIGRRRRSPCSQALNMLHRHRRNRSADYSRPIIRWRPPPKPARIRSPASTRSSRSVSSLRSDTQRNRSRAMRIRRRLTPRRPLGTWRSSSRSIRAMSVK